LLKALAASGESRHDGTDRYADDVGYFLVRQLFQLAQDDGFAKFEGQSFKAVVERSECRLIKEHGLGVYGRKSASAPGFAYSEALKKAGIRWDDATLDRWLSDPDAMVPDTDMAFRLANGEERKAVIAYLKSLGN
jgi:hypothetical protein